MWNHLEIHVFQAGVCGPSCLRFLNEIPSAFRSFPGAQIVKYPFLTPTLQDTVPSFKWWGRDEHTGDVRDAKEEAFLIQLDHKTSNAFISLCAGSVIWAAHRLQGYVPQAQMALQMAEAAFAYQIDWRYVNRDAIPLPIPFPDQERSSQESALIELCIFLWRSLNHEKYWENYYSPILETFHALRLERFILPESVHADFNQWTQQVIQRLDQVAPKPSDDPEGRKNFDSESKWQEFVSRHRGEALPIEILDPDFSLDQLQVQRQILIQNFLNKLQAERNPFLLSLKETP